MMPDGRGWAKDGACRGRDPALWHPTPVVEREEIEAFAARGVTDFPTVGDRHAMAGRRVCVGGIERREWIDSETGHVEVVEHEVPPCPVAVECAVYAVLTKQQLGVWGGLGADGKLKWLRSFVHGSDDGEPMVDVPDPGTAVVVELARRVETEQAALRGELSGTSTLREVQPARQCDRCGDWISEGAHPPDRNTAGAKCGKAVTYAKGCRCRRCEVANSLRER